MADNAIIAITEMERNDNFHFHSLAFKLKRTAPRSFECVASRCQIIQSQFSIFASFPPAIHHPLCDPSSSRLRRVSDFSGKKGTRSMAKDSAADNPIDRDGTRTMFFFRLSPGDCSHNRFYPLLKIPRAHINPLLLFFRLHFRQILHFPDG